MKSLIAKIIPTDPPMQPMTLSREPIVNRFWATGLVGLCLGFILGFMLWLWQQGIMETPDDYFTFKIAHAKIQILLFAGSFLLGFALQAGPHVIGGPPPPSKNILFYLPMLWVGIALSMVPDPMLSLIGNAMTSFAFAGPAFLLLGITMAGMPHFRIPRGIPISASFVILALAPWLDLNDPDIALFVIWCGPVTAALVAAQQLTNNVLGGKLLQGNSSVLFLSALYMAWLLTAVSAFLDSIYWHFSGIAWVVVLYIQAKKTELLLSAIRYNFSAIQVTLLLAFAGLFASAIMPIVHGEDFMADAAVHLLGAGVITILILGVAARVASFFCGQMVLPDRALIYLLFAWSILAIARTITPYGIGSTGLIMGTMHLGTFLLIIWVVPMARNIVKIGQQFPPPNKQ
ncbi:MAG: NnrS family protein [Magnetococcales bacterium]|nr:NnrS family protein [Magnetococcales bacterium]